MPIHIARPLINQILGQALRAPEQEICGLIGARDGTPQTVYPVANVAAERDHLFAMDPQQQIDAMRRMREAGEELFAIYHSHPHAPAAPSATDLAQAAYPDALYLIVSLDTQGVLDMRGYGLHAGQVTAVELEMIDL